jgi:hypothetical protein
MMVERRVQVTKKKTGGGLTMKTLEGVINYADETVNKKVSNESFVVAYSIGVNG